MNSFEMPKDDISRYDVVSKMLSKNKFDLLNAKINYLLLIGFCTIKIFFKHFFIINAKTYC